MIETEGLTRQLGGRTVVSDVTFRCEPGTVTGFLGPNGAGKTTTLRMLAGILSPDRGRVLVDGLDVHLEPIAAKRRIGFLSGDTQLYNRLTPREVLRYFGQLYELRPDVIASRSQGLIAELDMTDGQLQSVLGQLSLTGVAALDEMLGDRGDSTTLGDTIPDNGDGPGALLERSELRGQLAEAIEEWSEGRAVIVGGDTNLHIDAHPDSGDGQDAAIWETFLTRLGLVDSCDVLSYAHPGSIDKIAYRSGGGVVLQATSHDLPRARFRTASGEDLSDHPPVVVEFDWDRAAG